MGGGTYRRVKANGKAELERRNEHKLSNAKMWCSISYIHFRIHDQILSHKFVNDLHQAQDNFFR